MITPLLTQLTYEGLVDELIGIKNCRPISLLLYCGGEPEYLNEAHVELPLSLLSPPTAGPTTAASTSAPATSVATPIPVVAVKKDSKKKHHLTTATDPLFGELRDLNFSSVGKKLNRVAHRLDEDYKVKFLSIAFNKVANAIVGRQIYKQRPWPNYGISLGS